jgi:allophanate hydrolase subunit 2
MRFSLWRQDDNGNRFLVGDFPDRATAEARLAELNRSFHKQTYWISGTGDECNTTLQVQKRQPHSPDKEPS